MSAEETPHQEELLSPDAVGEEAVVPDADEAIGKDVLEEAADELDRREAHRFLAVSVGVVLPAKGDHAVPEGQDSFVGDGDPVGVSGQVLEDLAGPAEGGLGVDDPILPTEAA